MSSFRTAAFLALAGTATATPVTGVVLAGTAQGGASDNKATVRQVRPVTVTMSGKSCGHHVTPRSERLNATNDDALGWRIRNNCSSEQKVLLCVYKGGQLVNPFAPCVSTPTAGLDIGRPFAVRGGTLENLECTARQPGRYSKVVLVGNEVPATGCPGQLGHKVRPRTHRLDVEIVR